MGALDIMMPGSAERPSRALKKLGEVGAICQHVVIECARNPTGGTTGTKSANSPPCIGGGGTGINSPPVL